MGFLPGVPDDVSVPDEGDRAGVPRRGLDAGAAPGLRRRRGAGGVVVGQPKAYTETMGAWSVGGSVQLLQPWLEYVAQPWNAVKVALGLAIIVAMTIGPWAGRLGTELRTWTLAYTGYLILVDAPSTCLFRHLPPLFPLVVVLIGGGWRDRPPRWLGGRAGFLVVLGLAGQVWWVWALLRFVPPTGLPS